MPASTLDPVNAALRTALSKNTFNESTLDSQLAGSTKKALLSNIEFEAAGSYQISVLDKLKSKYIVLKSSETPELGNQNKLDDASLEDGLAAVKGELYPLKAVQLGWNNADWSVGAGMVNMGNTCYLNSTLQALFHAPAFVNWLMSEKQHMSGCDDGNGGVCVICAMRKTLQDSQQRNVNAIRPYLIYNKLRVLCKNMVPGRQEDAHEFMRYLIEAMEKAYLQRFKNHAQLDTSVKETTPLNQILGGYLRSAVRCLECGNVSTTFQHFQDIPLDVKKPQTLDEALELFFSKESLDDDSYHCELCKKKVNAWKQFTLERAPMVLSLQFKRFSVSNNKLTKHIQFRQKLDLSKYVRRKLTSPLTYRLVALVTHMGPTVNCGHYTAIAQAPSGSYYQFDDSIVKPISHQAVFGTTSYMMLYELESASSVPINGKIKVSSTISSVSQLNDEGDQVTEALSPETNGDVKVYGPVLPPNLKFQNLSNGLFITNGEQTPSESKHIEKENKPTSLANTLKSISDISANGNTKSPLSMKLQNSSTHKLSSLLPKLFPATTDALHNGHCQEQKNIIQTIPTNKLVSYKTDDLSNGSDELHMNGGTMENNSRIPTKAAASGDWKISLPADSKPEPSSQGNTWDKKKPNTVNELLKMSHNGYAAPVTSWNGTRSQLDREVNNERRDERKRASTDNLDQGRVKHVKLNSTNNMTSNYNPIQEYHSSRNWNYNNDMHQQRYNRPYYMGKNHRKDNHSYHRKNNYHKNYRFRH